MAFIVFDHCTLSSAIKKLAFFFCFLLLLFQAYSCLLSGHRSKTSTEQHLMGIGWFDSSCSD